MTFSSAKAKCRESTEEEKLNACTWEKSISPTAAQQTVNVYGMLQQDVDEEQVKPFTVSQENPERREKMRECERTGKQ